MRAKIKLFCTVLLFLLCISIVNGLTFVYPQEITCNGDTDPCFSNYNTVETFLYTDNPINITSITFLMKHNGTPVSQDVDIRTFLTNVDASTTNQIDTSTSDLYELKTFTNPDIDTLVHTYDVQLYSKGSAIGVYQKDTTITYAHRLIEFLGDTPDNQTSISGNVTIEAYIHDSSFDSTSIALYNSSSQDTLIKEFTFTSDQNPTALFNETHINNSLYDYSYWLNVTHTTSDARTYSTTREFVSASFTDCELSGSTDVVLNFTLAHEDDFSQLTGDIFVDITTEDGATTNLVKENVNSFALCMGGDNTFTINATINNDVTYRHNYYIVNGEVTTTTPQTITLYNYNETTDISTLQQFVENIDFTIPSGVYVHLERLYPPNNTYQVVQMDTVDAQGQTVFHIKEEDYTYRFKYYDGTNLIETTNDLKFICESGLCSVKKRIDTSDSTAQDSLTISQDYNNETGLLIVDWEDATATTSYVDITIEKTTGTGDVLLCSQSVYSASGRYSCNISGYTGTVVTKVYSSESNNAPVFSGVQSLPADFIYNYTEPEDQYFWTFILTLTFVGMGMYSSVGVLILMVASIIFAGLMGLASVINVSFIVILTVVSALVGAIVKR